MQKYKTHFLAIILGTYVISLLLPGLVMQTSTSYGHPVVMGYTILLWGWLGIFTGTYAWFANPLFFVSLFIRFKNDNKFALVFSVIAFCLGLLSFGATEWDFNVAGGSVIDHLGSGYIVWQLSLLLNVVYRYLKQKHDNVVP